MNDGTAGYLRRLGYAELPPPTLATLHDLHRAHLSRIPYENLGIQLGRPPDVAPDATVDRIAEIGRAGYCFHLNGAFQVLLRELGFSVERRHGHVWFGDEIGDTSLNHLALVASGLPSEQNPGGVWWVDVGLGDGFSSPLPVLAGEHRDGAFRYAIADATPDGWTFAHDPAGTFTGCIVSTLPTADTVVAQAHRWLSTDPSSPFRRVLVVQRRDADCVETLRGCMLLREDGQHRTSREVTTFADWRSALSDGVGLRVDDIDPDDLRSLWSRMLAVHEAWTAAGRP